MCHSETIEVPLAENLYLRHDLISSPFLTSMLISKEATLIFWKGYQDHHQFSEKSFISPELYYMAFILATSTLVIEEHTNLIDHLSEPSSWLIHHISHPS